MPPVLAVIAWLDRLSAVTSRAMTTTEGCCRRWTALAVVLVASFMDLLDVTIVNVAVPGLRKDLGIAYTAVQWVTAGYALAFGALLITGGRLGDFFCRKRMFLTGMGGFTAASTLCGFAPDASTLICARIAQGATAALMLPQVLALIQVTFPADERGKVYAFYGVNVGVATVSGPLIGGCLMDANPLGLGWRAVFLVNVPIGLAGMAVGKRFLPRSRDPHAARLDLVGVALATVGLLMLIYPLLEGRELHWPLWGFGSMAASVLVLACFAAYERRAAHEGRSPLVALRLFTARSFASGISVQLLFSAAVGILFLSWMLYMQLGLGWSPLHAGLTGIPFSVGTAVAAGTSVRFLVPRLGRLVPQAGILVMIAGIALFGAGIDRHGTGIRSVHMAPPLLVCGIGLGLVVAPLGDVVLTGVPHKDAGSASGLTSSTVQVGNAMGVALMSVFFFGLFGGAATHSVDQTVPEIRQRLAHHGLSTAQVEHTVAGFRSCAVDRATANDPDRSPASCAPDPRNPPDTTTAATLDELGRRVGGMTLSKAFRQTLWWVSAILTVAFLLMFALPRNVRRAGSVPALPGPRAIAPSPRVPTDRLRVALVTESFLPHVNGVTNSVVQILDHLHRQGHRTLLIAPGPGPAEHGRTPVVRVPCIHLPSMSSLPVGLPSLRLVRALRDFRPDVIHLASPFMVGAQGLLVAQRLGVPTVSVYQTDLAGFATCSGLGPRAAQAAWHRIHRLHAMADRTLAPSRSAAHALSSRGVPRVHLWPRGVDLDLFHPNRRDPALRARLAVPGQLIVGYVGRLTPEKQVERLAALHGLPGIRLVVVGDGPCAPVLRRLMPDAAFLGFRSGPELAAAYASLDVFIHTGGHETFCQGVQEALASGVPVLTPDTGGPRDLVRPGENGHLLPAHSCQAFASALRAAIDDLRDPLLRLKYAASARDSVLSRPWSSICAQLLDHYQEVLGPGTPDSPD